MGPDGVERLEAVEGDDHDVALPHAPTVRPVLSGVNDMVPTDSAIGPPVPSSTVSFTYSEAGGKALVDMPGLAAQEWTNSSDSSEVYAAPSPLSGGSNFAVSVPG